MARKVLTRDQAETAKKRAISFLRNVLQDDDRADEVESEDLDQWAEETGRTITNPTKRKTTLMANGVSKADLQDALDQIGDVVADALDPASERADLVQALQQIDALVSGDGDDDDDSDDDQD